MNKTLIDAAKEQLLRGLVLTLLKQTEPEGGSLELLQSVLKTSGYDLTREHLLTTLTYLTDKGLVMSRTVENKQLNISRFITKLTSKGVDLLEGTIQVEGIMV